MLPVDLREFIVEHFSRDELMTFCADYFRDFYQDFEGMNLTKTALARDLVEHCQRRTQLEKLQAGLQRARSEPYVTRFGRLNVATVAAKPRDARQVFLSHAHEDADFAQRLAHDLRAEGVSVWIAPDSIEPGESWMSAIDRGLGESGICIVALTPQAVQSSWVKSETEFALQQHQLGRGQLFTLMVKTCDVRRLSNLLTTRQYINFERDYATGLAELYRSLGIQSAAEREKLRLQAEEAHRREALERLRQEEQDRHRKAAEVEQARQLQQPREAEARVRREEPEICKTNASTLPEGEAPRLSRRRVLQFAGIASAGGIGILALSLRQPSSPLPATTEVKPTNPTLPTATEATPTTQTLKESPNLLTLKIATDVAMVFVRVPAGDFLMGSDPSADTQASADEQPQHSVFLSEYFIGKHEVTNAQFAVFAQANGIGFVMPDGKADHPVVNVDWEDATAFANWMSTQTSRRIVLPSEAQWEKAARGTDARIYPWGNAFDTSKANVNSLGTSPAGAYNSASDSPYGAADMAGNIWEWCADLYDEGAYKNRSGQMSRDPIVERGLSRVVRGGSWSGDSYFARAAFRRGSFPSYRDDNLGFRVVSGVAPVSS